jgi:hypothetical protein
MDKITLDSFLTPKGTLIFTLTSNGYKFYTLNLLRHLQKAGVAWRLCIFCADAASHKFFSQEGIPCRRLPDLLPEFGPQIVPFGSRQFQQLNRKKLEILRGLSAREDVKTGIYMDGDLAVYNDFLADVERRLDEGPRLQFQCDENTAQLDCSGATCPTPCSGFLAWRHGSAGPELFRIDETTREDWRQCPEDQVFIQRQLKRTGTPYTTFPRDGYPNGRFSSQFVKGSAKKEVAYLLHYNYLVGDAKRQRMRNNGDWLIPY